MKVLTKSSAVFRDRRDDRVYKKPVLARTPEEAQLAFAKSRGGVKNVEMLEFNGVPCDNPVQEEPPAPVDPDLPSIEDILSATYKRCVEIIQHYRHDRRHQNYFNHMGLKHKVEILQQLILLRLHPEDGVTPPDLPPPL